MELPKKNPFRDDLSAPLTDAARSIIEGKAAEPVNEAMSAAQIERICASVENDIKSIRIAAKRGNMDAVGEYANQAISALSKLES